MLRIKKSRKSHPDACQTNAIVSEEEKLEKSADPSG
jgi:hypothetical protein